MEPNKEYIRHHLLFCFH